jgi:hypothetical protein
MRQGRRPAHPEVRDDSLIGLAGAGTLPDAAHSLPGIMQVIEDDLRPSGCIIEPRRPAPNESHWIEALPAPVIAAVFGPALTVGCELVLGCDLAVCAEDPTFGQIEVNGGVVPAFVSPGGPATMLPCGTRSGSRYS